MRVCACVQVCLYECVQVYHVRVCACVYMYISVLPEICLRGVHNEIHSVQKPD